MAPPAGRRPGHSRRAQFSIFTGYVIAIIGAVTGAVLLIVSLWQPQSFSGLRGSAQDITRPVGATGALARSSTLNLFDTISGYFRAGRQNADLRHETEIARIRLAEAEAVEQENLRLKGLLDLTLADEKPVAITRFIGSSSSSTRRFGYIGAGSKDGVRAGMAVRSERGVMGRVLEVGHSTARVLLLTDSESVLPVRLARTGDIALAEGRSDGTLRIKLVNLGINPIKQGDVFITSGSGGYFQPGTAVAVATKITSDGAQARIISDPAATNFVAVMPVWQAELVSVARTPATESLPADPADGSENPVGQGQEADGAAE
ncbi:MAG: rod shape-determining protein MreC [Sphingomonadaceae bacterium]